MEKNFWEERWRLREIHFHEASANPLLVEHFPVLDLKAGARVFVPLCGKSLDISWLLSQGYQVAGVELVETAIVELFDELGVSPSISDLAPFRKYSADGIDIFVGDVFELTKEYLGRVDAVYDRAAYVALPDSMRGQYVEKVAEISVTAPQLLISFEYDTALMQGPPFSHSDDELLDDYAISYRMERIARVDTVGGLKGHPAQENIWHLTPLIAR